MIKAMVREHLGIDGRRPDLKVVPAAKEEVKELTQERQIRPTLARLIAYKRSASG